jgi:hypothetical protein
VAPDRGNLIRDPGVLKAHQHRVIKHRETLPNEDSAEMMAARERRAVISSG